MMTMMIMKMIAMMVMKIFDIKEYNGEGNYDIFYDFSYEEHPVPGLEYNVPALVRLRVEARIAGRCKDVHAARIQRKLLLLPRLFRPTIQTSCKTFQIHCLLRIHLCPNQNLTSCSLVIFWCRCGEVIHFCLAHIQMVVMRPDLKICLCGYFIEIQS